MLLTPTGLPRPSIVMLASGGIRVLSYVGALEELDRNGCLGAVRTWCGVSGGALIATALAFGYTYAELREICERFDFGVLKHIDEQSPLRLLEGCYGLDSGKMLARFCSALAHVKGLPDTITFGQLAERAGPTLRIWCADLETGQARVMSAGTTPEFPVLQALQASMSIPIVYEPVVGPSGELLVDGALLHSYPVHTLPASERVVTLGIIPHNRNVPVQKSEGGIKWYLVRCWTVMFDHRSDPILELFRGSTIQVEIDTVSATDFDLDADERAGLVMAGRRAAREYLRAFKQRRFEAVSKQRRWSV
jgi:NTE family protein